MRDCRSRGISCFALLVAAIPTAASCALPMQGEWDGEPCYATRYCVTDLSWKVLLNEQTDEGACYRLHIAICEAARCHETNVDVRGTTISGASPGFFSERATITCGTNPPEGVCLDEQSATFTDWAFQDATYRFIAIDRLTGATLVDESRPVTYHLAHPDLVADCPKARECRQSGVSFWPATPGPKEPLPGILLDDAGHPTAVGPCGSTP